MSYVKRALESQQLRFQHQKAGLDAWATGYGHAKERRAPRWPKSSVYYGNYASGYLQGAWQCHLVAAMSPDRAWELIQGLDPVYVVPGAQWHNQRTVVQLSLLE